MLTGVNNLAPQDGATSQGFTRPPWRGKCNEYAAGKAVNVSYSSDEGQYLTVWRYLCECSQPLFCFKRPITYF